MIVVTHVLEKENDGSNIDRFFRSSILRLDGLSCAERLCASAAIVEISSSSLELCELPVSSSSSLESFELPFSSSSSNQALCKDLFRELDARIRITSHNNNERVLTFCEQRAHL